MLSGLSLPSDTFVTASFLQFSTSMVAAESSVEISAQAQPGRVPERQKINSSPHLTSRTYSPTVTPGGLNPNAPLWDLVGWTLHLSDFTPQCHLPTPHLSSLRHSSESHFHVNFHLRVPFCRTQVKLNPRFFPYAQPHRSFPQNSHSTYDLVTV